MQDVVHDCHSFTYCRDLCLCRIGVGGVLYFRNMRIVREEQGAKKGNYIVKVQMSLGIRIACPLMMYPKPLDQSTLNWLAVKELNFSHHNGYVKYLKQFPY